MSQSTGTALASLRRQVEWLVNSKRGRHGSFVAADRLLGVAKLVYRHRSLVAWLQEAHPGLIEDGWPSRPDDAPAWIEEELVRVKQALEEFEGEGGE